MPAGKKGKKSKTKPEKRQSAGPDDSVTWEEHGERVRFALAIGTGLFLKANAERIEGSSSEVAARNSYMSGMLDMLTIARNAIGFWGAHQILMELERLNRKRSPAGSGPEPSIRRPAEPRGSGGQADGGGFVEEGPSLGDTGQKATKMTRRDPMFA